jgi:hypothetical protein
MCFEEDDVREEIPSRKSEVLNDEIACIVRVLDTRNWELSDFVDERGQEDFPGVIPELCLELETALAVEKQIFREPWPILAKTLVERIVTHCLEPVPDTGKKVVEIGLGCPVVELMARFVDGVTAVVAVGLKDAASLEKDLRYILGHRIVKGIIRDMTLRMHAFRF